MNRPSQRRADPHHPHTQKAIVRQARRDSRADARWHARWEHEQHGGSLDESHSPVVLDALAQGVFDATPHRHPSGRRPDWSMQPASVRDVFVAAASVGAFLRTGAHPLVARSLFRLSVLSRRREGHVPTEAAVVAAIRIVTVDLPATADLDIDVIEGGDGSISIFSADAFTFHTAGADGSIRH